MNRPSVGFWPVFLRIAVGVWWLIAGTSKVLDPGYATSTLGPTLMRWSTLGHGPIASFDLNYVLPNVAALAFALKAAELLVGAALVLGLLTRLAALGGFLVLVVAWVLQAGFSVLGGYGSGTFLGMITMLYLVLSPSGHILAMDAMRSARKRSRNIAAAPPARPATTL